jgi:hypothetical protein
MRTAAHSCLMRRKSLGGARTTAATTELNESDDACDASVAPSPARDDADDELRHSRAHLRPLLPAAFSVAFRPTSDLIHFPDCPIAAATTRDATACLFLCSAEASFRLGSPGAAGGGRRKRRMRGVEGAKGDRMEVVGELTVVLFGRDKGRGGKPFVVRGAFNSKFERRRAETGIGGGRAAKLAAPPLTCGPCTRGPTCRPRVPGELAHGLAGFVCVGPRERWSPTKMGPRCLLLPCRSTTS